MTELHPVVDRWLREGRSAGPGEQVAREHLKACLSCRHQLQRLDELRAFFPAQRVLSDATLAELSFGLQREARLAQERYQRPLRRHSVRKWGMAPLALLVLIGLTVFKGREAFTPLRFFGSQSARKSLKTRTMTIRSVPPAATKAANTALPHDVETTHAPVVDIEQTSKRVSAKFRAAQRAGATPIVRANVTNNDDSVAGPGDDETPTVQESNSQVDHAFIEAWRLFRKGEVNVASQAFDELLQMKLGSRRPDILFWAAQAHYEAGNYMKAKRRLAQLVRAYPLAWRAESARTLLQQL